MTNVTTTADQAKKALNRVIPETNKTQAQIEDLIIRARVNMLIGAPFFGTMATRLLLKDATAWCPTAATDGRYFYFNRNFIAALSDRELIFLMGHEVLHCVYDHMNPDRRGDRIHELWNIANDRVINLDLVEASIGERITLVEICFNSQDRGKLSEEIYDEIYKEMEQQGRIKYVSFDMHLEGGDQPAQDGNEEGENDGTNGPVRYTENEQRQIQQEVINATIQAAKAAGSGNLPAGVRRLVDALINPQIDWRDLIPQRIQSTIKSNYTMMRPSRKSQDSGFYLAGMDREDTVDVAVTIDASGSMTPEMLKDILSEIHGIMQQYADYTVNVWSFDTQVYNHQVFTQDNGENLLDYQVQGGGGTDFMCNWEYMKEAGITPKLLIMFTDGYPWGSWGEDNYCDTIFVVHGQHHDRVPEAPFGVTVPYKHAA